MMIVALRKVIKRRHYPLEVMLTCMHALVRGLSAEPASHQGVDGRAWRSSRSNASRHPCWDSRHLAALIALIAGIEAMYMIRKGQLYAPESQASAATSQFYSLAF